MGSFLLLSNGHGEDLSGALIGKALKEKGHKVLALPLVGKGNAYLDSGIRVLKTGQEFRTGGIGYTSFKGRLTEILEGQLFYLISRLFIFFQAARKFDLIIIIGDVVPLLATWIIRQKSVIYLVAYSSHYEGKLNLPWPCTSCLKSKRILEIFSRDLLTAKDLSQQLNREVKFLGNPFMDEVLKKDKTLPKSINRIGLLPGSRRPELEDNLLLIISVIQEIPSEAIFHLGISFDLALVRSLDDYSLEKLIYKKGWRLIKDEKKNQNFLISKQHKINLHRDSFRSILQSSDLLISMAGTAAEQAVGLSKPVLQINGKGPQFTSSFAEAQRRLLGPTVFCARGQAENSNTLKETARLILKLLDRIHNSPEFRVNCTKQAKLRLGEAGGSEKIASLISNLVSS